MRLPLFAFLLLDLTLFALFPTLVSSSYPHSLTRQRDSNRSLAPHVLTSRQYHVARDLLDVCINANVDLVAADASQLLGLSSILGPLEIGSKVQLCLCLKDLDIYLNTNDNVQALVGILGKNTVGTLITTLINASPDAQKCTFPQHTHHTCNTYNPCHYECDPPYILEGGECVCAPPYSSCNDVCGIFPKGCGSAVPRSLQKHANSISTIAQAKASCKRSETVCGIVGQEKTLAFECIDTRSSKDSCGGCITPHPFFEAEPIRHTSGKDCTAISNVVTSSCFEHRCVVQTCKDGWIPSLDKDVCVPVVSRPEKARMVKKRSYLVSANSSVAQKFDSNLIYQLVNIVQSVLDLNANCPSASASIAGAESISERVTAVNAAVTALITSSSDPSSLEDCVDTLLNSCSSLRTTLDNCEPAYELSELSKTADHLVAASLALKGWCSHSTAVHGHNSVYIHPSRSALTDIAPRSFPDADGPVVAGLTDILTDIDLGPGADGVAVDGLVDPALSESLNDILNGLSLGPANYKRQYIPLLSTNATATATIDSDVSGQLEALVKMIIDLLTLVPSQETTPSSSSDGSITSSPSTVLVGLENLNQATVEFLQSTTLSLLYSNVDALYASERALQVILDEEEVGWDGILNQLVSVIGATLNLKGTLVGRPAASGTVVSGARGPSSTGTVFSVGVATPSPISPHSTYATPSSDHAAPTPALTSTSPVDSDIPVVLGLGHLLASLGLGGVTSVTTVDRVDLSNLETRDQPIEIGFTKLLKEVGLDMKVDTIIDGVLSDGPDTDINSLLDDADIGPSGMRREYS